MSFCGIGAVASRHTGVSSPSLSYRDDAVALSVEVAGHKSGAGDMHRFIASQLQSAGYSAEQAALLTLQIMQEALKTNGDTLDIRLGMSAYQQQLELTFGPASA